MLKYLPLLWAGLWRKPVRTVFTFLSIATAFVLFGLLQGVNTYFGKVIDASSLDRLLVQNRIMLVEPLPYAHLQRIAQVPGVAAVTHSTWFGGYYRDLKDFTASFAVDIQSFAVVYPELKLPADVIGEMSRTPTAAVIGPGLAKKYGWKVGDEVPLQSGVWLSKSGQPWRFRIAGIYECERCASADLFLMNYGYLNAGRAVLQDTVGQFVLKVENPRQAAAVAFAIDEAFANSSAETRTQSERDSAQSQLRRIGDVNFFVKAVLGAVFFALLLLTTNITMQSFRERTAEFAVLKTVGYGDVTLALLVIGEAMLLCLVAAAAGLALAEAFMQVMRALAGVDLQGATPFIVLVLGLSSAIVLAIVGSIVPGLRASRLSIVDALVVQ